MDNERKLELLANANRELAAQYKTKHVELTMLDIDKVYERNILSVNADAKTKKGNSNGYLTGILYLAPAKQSGMRILKINILLRDWIINNYAHYSRTLP